jgi:hypothetical protein
LRALRKLQREQERKSPFVFTSERGSPFTTAGFARMVERAWMIGVSLANPAGVFAIAALDQFHDEIFDLPLTIVCSLSQVMAARSDYYIVTRKLGVSPYPWCWEIQRYSRPMGVKVQECGFQSRQAAEYAGHRALEQFLNELGKEERRR